MATPDLVVLPRLDVDGSGTIIAREPRCHIKVKEYVTRLEGCPFTRS
jgi:hypothetical protein